MTRPQAPGNMRKHHKDVITALRTRDQRKAMESVDEYMSKGQELLAALTAMVKSSEVAPAHAEMPAK